MDENITPELPEISDEKEEPEPKSPQFTTLTTVRYDDYMELSNAVLHEPVVTEKMDFDDSNQVSSTTGLSACQESQATVDVVSTHSSHEVLEVPVENKETGMVPVNDEINASVSTPEITPKVKRKYKKRVKEISDPNDISFSSFGEESIGKSKYGRVRKQKLTTDYVSLDRKSFAVLNSLSYKPTNCDEAEVKPLKSLKLQNTDRKVGKKRGRKRKVDLTPVAVVPVEEPVIDDPVTEHINDQLLESPQASMTEDIVSNDAECSKSSMNLSAIKTYSRKSDSISNTDDENQVSQLNLTELNWKVGDVAWAKIGSFPYWPSIITLEYGTSIYVKNVGKKQNRLLLHVQFFGDRGRRSWVRPTSLIKYESKDQFFELKRMYRKDKIRMKSFFVLTRFQDLWGRAISEADTILKLPHEERIPYYQNLYPINEEVYAIELANINRVKRPVIHRRKIGEKRGRKRKIPIGPDGESLNNVGEGPYPEGKRTRQLDEHTKTRIAFMRRMNRILKQSKLNLHARKKRKNIPQSNDPFNKLLENKNERIYKMSMASNLNSSPETKKNDLSVYDFESDEDTDVFIGTYNSKFTPQILNRIEDKVDSPSSSRSESKATVVCHDESSLNNSSLLDSANDSSLVQSATETESAATPILKIPKVEGKRRGRKKKIKVEVDGVTPVKRKRGRPRKIRLDDENGVKDDTKEKGQTTKELNRDPFEDFRCHVMEKLQNDHPEWSDDEKERLITKMWSDLEVSQKPSRWYSTYDTSSDEEESGKPRSPSPQVSAARMKKLWNIFSGYKVDKVCQICLKSGDTIKCRGPCSGHYHLKCVQEEDRQPEPMNPKRKRGRQRSIKTITLNGSGNGDSVGSSNMNESIGEALNSAAESCALPKKLSISLHDVLNKETNSEASPKYITANVEERGIIENGDTQSTRVSYNDPVTSSDIVDQSENIVDEEVKVESKCLAMEKSVVSGDRRETAENEISSSTSVNNFKDHIDNPEESDQPIKEELDKAKVETDIGTEPTNENGQGSGKTDGDFWCRRCSENKLYPCFVCGKEVHDKTDETLRHSCNLATCGRVYHRECLKEWPQATWINGPSKESLKCPQHFCHTCISENPAVLKNRQCNENVVKCVKCPASYHKRVYCIPAGTEILTSSQIICPRHYQPPRGMQNIHFNASWCFICCIGGSLICCDECPTSFHADCLKLHPEEYEGRYICDDCQCGRLLLYGEITWVKLGHYRWWPARILFPHEVPENLLNLQHRQGEFVVKFFGSHNFNWVNRGRAFVYQEGDSGKKSSGRSSVDVAFEKAMAEADEAYKKLLVDKAARHEVTRVGLKPPRYAKIRANKPVGNVRIVELNTSNQTACECDPKSERPCAPDSDCINRMLLVECNPSVCLAGERCMNQAFEKRVYPPLMPYKTLKRGWGLKTLVEMKKGDFIIEYVGEMIDEEEYKRRVAVMHENQEDNYYFLTIDKDRMLDAGPKGNVARFMNHSCDPNCVTQKWTVNGDTRIGLFALRDIPANTELVFNYNLATQEEEKRPCYCGAENCSGFIGMKIPKNGNGNGNGNGDEDQRKNSNEYSQNKLVNDRVMKRSRKRRLPGAVMKRAATKRTTDIRIRKQLDEMKRKRRMTHKISPSSKPKLLNKDSDLVKTKENESEKVGGNNEEEEQKSPNIGTKATSETSNKFKKSIVGSRIRFKGSVTTKRGPGKPRKNLKTRHRVEVSLMKSNTPIGQFVNKKVEALYKSQDTYMKKNGPPTTPQTEKDGPKVERRGRKKRPKTEEGLHQLIYEIIKRKVEKKVQTVTLPRIDDKCFKCNIEGELLFCDNNECPRGYHLPCVDRNSWPTGRWLCPWHYCNICQSKRKIIRCTKCVNAFCDLHYNDNIFQEPDKKNSCVEHKSANATEVEIILTPLKPATKSDSRKTSIVNIEQNSPAIVKRKVTRKMLIKEKIALRTEGDNEYIEQIIIVEKPCSSDEFNNDEQASSDTKIKDRVAILNENQTNGPSMPIPKVSQTARKSISTPTHSVSVKNEIAHSCENDELVQEDSDENDDCNIDNLQISDDEYTNFEVEVVNEDDEVNKIVEDCESNAN